MNFNRRDLLKYFGIGSAIVPVIGGEPLMQAEAKLVQPAQVVPSVTTHGQGGWTGLVDPGDCFKVTLEHQGSKERFEFYARDMKLRCEPVETPSRDGIWREFLPGPIRMNCEVLRGVVPVSCILPQEGH